ncbi:MAG: SDR family NAD(P)-dependent oxidoreductase [Nitrospirae bacterium]|nr:SDR family NAD(P)-dependent oxidoreductase [Nitrospirota bacterium]
MNKVVLITGASRGLGRLLALRFAEAGCRVVINYLKSKEAAVETADEIINKGGEAVVCYADVGCADDVNSMIESIVQRWGAIGILINNAGKSRDNLLMNVKTDEWEDVLRTNLTGTFNTMRAAADVMIKNGTGHIINISSYSGIKGRAGQSAYAASKAGLIGLTKSAALELGSYGIQVNAVIPGFLNTDMTADLTEPIRGNIISSNILQREQDMEEVADFIYNLSTMKNVSGQVFNLDSRIV